LKQNISKISSKLLKYKTLIQSFSYLSLLQLINMALPLITFPYLIRVLGKDTYGLVVFAQAVCGYLVILVGFGFSITGTQEVSIHRENKDKLSEIISSIFIIKGVLLLIAFLILAVLLYFIPQAKGYKCLFFLSMWYCLYDVIFPGWYFQGIERMKYITVIILIMRTTFLVLIFIFIKAPTDFLLVPIMYGIGALTAGISALFIIFSVHKIKFVWPDSKVLSYYFKSSVPIFISNISNSLYASTNKVLIGTFLGMEDVAYYDLAEKLTNVLKIPQGILSQSLFPKISKDKDLVFVKKMFKYSLILNIGLLVFFVLFSTKIIIVLGSKQMLPALNVVIISSLTVPIMSMSNIWGIQMLIPFGYIKKYTRIILLSGLIYLLQLLVLWFTFKFSIIGITIVTLNTEIFVSLLSCYYCKKYKLW